MMWIAILGLGIVSGTVSGIVGFGASILLLPALIFIFGPQESVPIMAIAALMANFGRVLTWWRDVDWKANAYYCATAVPAAALGARTLLLIDPRTAEAGIGGFFLAVVPLRRWLLQRGFRIHLWHLALVGAGIGFLTGIVASTGPVNTPFFLAYGLSKGAFLGTEALGSMAIGITKSIVFRSFDALPLQTIGRGLLVGASLMIGSRLAKGFVLALDPARFAVLMDLLLVSAGAVLIWSAFAH